MENNFLKKRFAIDYQIKQKQNKMVSVPNELKKFVKVKITSYKSLGIEFVIHTYYVVPTD